MIKHYIKPLPQFIKELLGQVSNILIFLNIIRFTKKMFLVNKHYRNVFVIQRIKYNWMCNFIKSPINEQSYNIMSSKNAVFFLYCRQTMDFLIFLMLSVVVSADTSKESCKDMLQGYLTGQLSSALGYQVEALRREFVV